MTRRTDGMEEKNLRGEARILGSSGHEGTGGASQHTLRIVNREQVEVEGVLAVESFDDQEIVLETELGTLTLRGEDLHIKQLDLESGRFAVEGLISACMYSNLRHRGQKAPRGRSILERLLK